MINMLLSLINLFFCEVNRKKGRLKKTRRSLNKVLKHNLEDFDFLLAYDAFIMTLEDRLPEARSRFEECVEKLSDRESEDSQYISLFCRFFLSIYNSNGEAINIRSDALKLNPDPLTKMFLKFPSEKKLRQIISV